VKPTLIQRIGGRRAISLTAWAWMAPVSILGFFFTVDLEAIGASSTEILTAAAFSHLVAGAVMLLARATYLRPAEPTTARFWLAISTYPLVGIAGGIAYAYQLSMLGAIEQDEFVERVVTRTWITLVWNIIATLVLDENDRYQKIARELSAELQTQEELVISRAEMVQQVRANMVDSVKETLNSALREVAPSDLNRLADEIITPMRKQLSQPSGFHLERKQPTFARPSLKPLLARALLGAGNPWIIGFGAVAGVLANSVRQRGSIGLLTTFIVAVMLAGLVFALKSLAEAPRWLKVVTVATGSVLVLLVAFGLDSLVQAGSLVLVSAAFGSLLVAFFLTMFFALQLMRTEQISQLVEAQAANHWSQEKLRQQLWAESRRLAKFIHAEIQGRIRAAAISESSLSTEHLTALRERCLSLLDDSLGHTDFDEFVKQTNAFWGEVVEIEWQIATDARAALGQDSFSELAVIEALRDALVNAVRHGRASKVMATISLVASEGGPELRVSLWNNGRELEADSSDGFGGEVFSEVTSRWTLENRKDGVEFLAFVPTVFSA